MNAADAIDDRATARGWHRYAREYNDHSAPGRGWMLVSYSRDNVVLKVRYYLFGGHGSKRMMDWYGKDTSEGQYVNWGVDYAEVKVIAEDRGVKSWFVRHAFTGKNKKAQVLRWLKDN